MKKDYVAESAMKVSDKNKQTVLLLERQCLICLIQNV
jgi:hypothetical protein